MDTLLVYAKGTVNSRVLERYTFVGEGRSRVLTVQQGLGNSPWREAVMKRAYVAGLFLVAMLSAAESDELWWQGTFVYEGSASCEANDTISTYEPNAARFWEWGCDIDRVTSIRGMAAILLDQTCHYEGDGKPTKIREMLLNLGNGKIARFPDLKTLERCPVERTSGETSSASGNAKLSLTACEWNSRVYRAQKDSKGSVYQELQFLTGSQEGTVRISQYDGSMLQWMVTGQHSCSNGASICRFDVPLASGDSLEVLYELYEGSDGYAFIAILGFAQQVFQLANGGGATDDDSGMKTTWRSIPAGAMVVPQNVFKLSWCSD